MARSFREMLDNTSDAELGAMCRDRFERLMDAHSRGLTDEHPAEAWNADNRVLRAHAGARDTGADPGDQPGGAFNPANVASSKEIERTDQPRPQTATDDPAESPGKPPNPQRNGAELAAHDSAEEFRIRQQGVNVDNDLLLARARRSDARRVAEMSAAIPGYDRIR